MKISRRQTLAALPVSMLFARLADGQVSGADARLHEFTTESELATKRGTQWLLRAMHRDGGCGVDVGQQADIGCTSMTGLALLAQGNTPVEGPYSREVQRLLSFVLRAVDEMPGHDITRLERTQLQNKIGRHAHSFFAALFLSQIVGECWHPEPVRKALAKLVEVIGRAQSPDGHWGTSSWAPTLGTVMGWVSLRAAYFAGVSVGNAPDTTARYLVREMDQRLSLRLGGWMHELYKNATGIRVLHAMGMDDEPIAETAFQQVLKLVTRDNTAFSQAGGEEFLAFHLITETMLGRGGEPWRLWYPVVRDKIVAVQNADGSWIGRHCITSRTFCTAAALLVLAAPNRYLPISQP